MESNPLDKYAALISPDMEIEEMAQVVLKGLEECGLDTPEVREVIDEISRGGAEMREETRGLSRERAAFLFHMKHKEKIDESFAKLYKVTMEAFEEQNGRQS
jgi:hypothetical protein